VVPAFKAGYHYGTVITGEIGDIKKDIVFHGDTINTASRIRSECTVAKKDLLMSADLLQRISIDDSLTPETIGKIHLRGRQQEIELYTVKEAA
jgi:adenylate cyclase